jgi:hypothetical protein
MTAGETRAAPPAARPGRTRAGAPRPAMPPRTAIRLMRLHATSRRVPLALAAIAACAVGLRIALVAGRWDTYGALQLPLVFETAAATAITVSTASPLGEPERVTGRWLPYLRLAAALALTAAAAVALAAAGAGAGLAGGDLDVLRNLAGLTGIGLLCAAALGGGLGWAGPVAYLMPGAYALYTQWHRPALTTPWLWPARPQHDLGAAVCAGVVFAAGVALITVRGARDRPRGGRLTRSANRQSPDRDSSESFIMKADFPGVIWI